jgi:hypothetical protein
VVLGHVRHHQRYVALGVIQCASRHSVDVTDNILVYASTREEGVPVVHTSVLKGTHWEPVVLFEGTHTLQ